MFHSRDGVFLENFIFPSKLFWLTKNLSLCLIWPKDILQKMTRAFQNAFRQIPIRVFYISLSGILLGFFSQSPFSFLKTFEQQGQLCLEVFLGSFPTIWTIFLFRLGPFFLLHPCPGMLAIVPQALKFLIMVATLNTGISVPSEMVLFFLAITFFLTTFSSFPCLFLV